MYKSLCEKIINEVQKDMSIRDDKKTLIISKISELSILLYDDVSSKDSPAHHENLSMLEDFETKHPLITFCIDCISRTMSRLGM